VLLISIAAIDAQALETSWNVTSGSWFEAANWTAGPPNLATDARVNNAGTAQITSGGAQAFSVLIGDSASGELQISAGGVILNRYGLIGFQSGSSGAVTVAGSSASWTNSVHLIVGDHGTGELTIADGGAVSDENGWIGYWPGADGTVSVIGDGSSWTHSDELVVGATAAAVLNITDGGTVSAATIGRVGMDPGADGVVTVSGAGSILTSGALYVGQYGRGELTIANGGTVATVEGRITGGEYSGSTPPGSGKVTVTGAGSAWVNSGSLLVAEFGSGQLMIADGGSVSNTFGQVGSDSFAPGIVTVTGAGSSWTNSNDVIIGRYSNATLSIAEGGLVSDVNAELARFAGSDVTVSVAGGGSTWTNSGSVYVGGWMNAAGGNAQLSITDAGRVEVADTLKLWSTGTVTIDGGSLTAHSFDRTVGTFNHLDGTLMIDGGTYARPAGILAIDGATPTAHASLVLANGAVVNGVSGVTVGDTRRGSLTISGGTSLTNPGLGRIGGIVGSHGDVTVRGAQSAWINSGSLTVGSQGMGELTIEEGGQVANTIGWVASSAGSVGSVIVTGEGSTWSNSSDLRVGVSGTGTLTIADRGKVSNRLGSIASQTGSAGIVRVVGEGSTWTSTGNLIVGDRGIGTLDIANSALVDVGGETFVGNLSDGGRINFVDGILRTRSLLAAANRLAGTGTVDANGLVTDIDLVFDMIHGLQQQLTLAATPEQNITVNLDVNGSGVIGTAYRGEGSFTIADGRVVGGRDGYLAYHPGSAATAAVDGPGSSWTSSGSLIVGLGGSAELTIANSANVSSGFGSIARDFTSVGLVNVMGQGAVWNNTGNLIVGISGHGELVVADGGEVTSNGSTIGSAGSGNVTVTGAGSSWTNSGSLSVGSKGFGQLTIAAGGVVSNTSAAINSFATSESVVIVTGSGSRWTISGSVSVGTSDRSPSATNTSGRLTVADGAVITADGCSRGSCVSPGVIIRSSGILLGDGTIVANISSDGTVAPGASLGTLHVTGDYTQLSSGKLRIELASPSGYDKLDVTGDATLSGELSLALLADYVPTPGQMFEVLTANHVTNNGLMLPISAAGLFQLVVDDTSVILQAIGSGVPGDFSGDGVVDAADSIAWRKGLGTIFNENHYNLWRTSFGAAASSAVGGAPVPESSSFVLTCFAFAAGTAHRRRVTK
jgi:T5SS/PEP-CTERM-associated repeat protein